MEFIDWQSDEESYQRQTERAARREYLAQYDTELTQSAALFAQTMDMLERAMTPGGRD